MVVTGSAPSSNTAFAAGSQTLEPSRLTPVVVGDAFTDRYNRVLDAADEQIPRVSRHLSSLSGALSDDSRPPVDHLLDYFDAMCVQVDDEPVFLPSFSDQCLLQSLSDPTGSLLLSPFRGFYYTWQLGEIATLLGQALHRRTHRLPHPLSPEARP